jgi:predicted DNA-binding transcriptional regulator YafY
MNRIDRLFAILLAIQNSKRIRGQDLADRFEVSKRTIYRDIQALTESGVPVVSLPGEGYELAEGYYLPPLNFTETEAVALLLGTELLRQQAAGSVTAGAKQALEKISAALPGTVRSRVEALTEIIGFFTGENRFNLDDPRLLILQKAIQEKRVISLRYYGRDREKTTTRTVEPCRLFYVMGTWYFEGYCRLRGEMRTFRLSRVEKLTLGIGTFEKREYRRTPPDATVTVRIRFSEKIVRWVRERQYYGFQKEQTRRNGTVMTYKVIRPADILPWTLGWGSGAEVLEPEELRTMVRTESKKMFDMLT